MEDTESRLKEVIKGLNSTNDRFQAEVIREAVNLKEAITPQLLSILECVIKNPKSVKDDSMAHLYAIFLLAEFREPLAFPLFIKLFHLSELEDLCSFEFTIESGHQVLASVFNGDLEALYNLYDDDSLEEDSRLAGIKAIFSLINENIVQENDCASFIKERLKDAIENNEIDYATTIVEGIRHCKLKSLQDLAEKAISLEVVDELALEWSESAANFENGKSKIFRFVKNAEEEMSWWACFQE